MFVSKGPIDNNTALVQIMDWCQKGHKSLSEPMMALVGIYIYIYICIYTSMSEPAAL